MRRSFLGGIYRPQGRETQLLDTARRVQRTERAKAALDASQVRRETLRALPLRVRTGSRVEIEVRVS